MLTGYFCWPMSFRTAVIYLPHFSPSILHPSPSPPALYPFMPSSQKGLSKLLWLIMIPQISVTFQWARETKKSVPELSPIVIFSNLQQFTSILQRGRIVKNFLIYKNNTSSAYSRIYGRPWFSYLLLCVAAPPKHLTSPSPVLFVRRVTCFWNNNQQKQSQTTTDRVQNRLTLSFSLHLSFAKVCSLKFKLFYWRTSITVSN